MDYLSQLPIEILSEIFLHLLLTTPNPILRKSEKSPRGYLPSAHLRIHKRPTVNARTRYLHPLIALKHVSSRLNANVESFCEHVLRTGGYVRTPPDVPFRRKLEWGESATFNPHQALSSRKASCRLLVMMWEFCVYCGDRAARRGRFLKAFGMCERCEIPSIPERKLGCEYPLTRDALDDHEVTLRKAMVYDCPHTNATPHEHRLHHCVGEIHYALHEVKAVEKKLKHEKEVEKAWKLKHKLIERDMERGMVEALRAGMVANGLEPVIKIINLKAPALSLPPPRYADVNLNADCPSYTTHGLGYDRLRREGFLQTRSCAEIVRYQVLFSRMEKETDFFTSMLPYIKQLGKVARTSDPAAPPKRTTGRSSMMTSSSRRNIEFIKAFQVDDKKIRLMSLELLDVGLFVLFRHDFNVPIRSPTPENVLKQYIQLYSVWGKDVLMPWSLDVYPQPFKAPPLPPPEKYSQLPPSVRKQYYLSYPLPRHITAYRRLITDFVGNPKTATTCLLNPMKYAKASRMREWVEMGLYGPTEEQNLLKRQGIAGLHGKLEVWLNRSIMNTSRNNLL